MKFNRLELEEIKMLAYSLIDDGEVSITEENQPNLFNKIKTSNHPKKVEESIEFILMNMVSELTGVPIDDIDINTIDEDDIVSEVIEGTKNLIRKAITSTKEVFSEDNLEEVKINLELGLIKAREKASELIDVATTKGEMAKDYLSELKADYEEEKELNEIEKTLRDMEFNEEDEEAHWNEYWNGYFKSNENNRTFKLEDLLELASNGEDPNKSEEPKKVYMTGLEYLEFLELKSRVPSLFQALLIISESPDSEFYQYLCGEGTFPEDETDYISDKFIYEFSRAWDNKDLIEIEK